MVDLSCFRFQHPLKNEVVHFHRAVLEWGAVPELVLKRCQSILMGSLRWSLVNYPFSVISIPRNSSGFPPLWNSRSWKLTHMSFRGSSVESGVQQTEPLSTVPIQGLHTGLVLRLPALSPGKILLSTLI